MRPFSPFAYNRKIQTETLTAAVDPDSQLVPATAISSGMRPPKRSPPPPSSVTGGSPSCALAPMAWGSWQRQTRKPKAEAVRAFGLTEEQRKRLLILER
jgi:hypothetical protein